MNLMAMLKQAEQLSVNGREPLSVHVPAENNNNTYQPQTIFQSISLLCISEVCQDLVNKQTKKQAQ